ncbi:MAG: energy transducer TonB [Cyanobacteria bacterium REEB67]|nr:energy transducer TonB [Cyanobacteria bacterium REEB67]
MTSVSPKNAGSQRPKGDPNAVGMMSFFLPGLGQMANGEQRKGLLFMIVGILNYIALVALMLAQPIMVQIQAFATAYNVRPNNDLALSFSQLGFPSPASLLLTVLFIAFGVFAARDAHDKAANLKRQAIYHDHAMEMPEATSGSYIFHASLLLTCFVLAFFFLIPPPPRSQVTDIEFIQNEENTKEPPKTQKRAQHNSKAGGKHDPTKPSQQPTPAPKAASKPTPEAKPQQKQSKPATNPTPTPSPSPTPRPTPTPVAHPSPNPSPRPTPTPSPAPSPTPTPSMMPKIPNPFVAPSAAPSPHPSPSPSPVAMPKIGSVSPVAVPRAGVGAGSATAPGPAPAPISVASASGAAGGGGPPTPVPVGGGATSRGGGSGPSAAPAPSRGGRGSGGGAAGGGSPGISVAPSVARSGGGGGGSGEQGNPDDGPGRPSVEARKDVDFGPYMADLQRRIKRAWFPPKGNESKRVKVVFKVHKDGQMTNLRILISAGLQIADAAALKAVENAAPFRPLPDGAPSDVDIEFTFDYNVFNGGGKGVFRQF